MKITNKKMKNKKRIYLDNASTTKTDKSVLREMIPYFEKKYGNPSSIHSFGQEARIAIDDSREKIANFLNCNPEEVVFTGSATEANNIFIQGILDLHKNSHVITSAIEHDSVLETVKNSGADYTVLSVDKDGFIDPEELKREVKEETVLISIMYANNEIGTIEPIEKISKIIEKLNQKKERRIYFHTDAVQAAGYLDCNIKKLKVDGLTMSGHKIYGPKGIGVLYKKNDIKINPIIFGGGQENGIRSGTYNTPSIVGMAKAVDLIKEKRKKKETEDLRDYLIKEVLKIEDSFLNGPEKERLPNNANFSFRGVEGESIVMFLDQRNISLSTGSACSSRTLEPSHVLRAIGLDNLQAHSSVRVSLGRDTTKKDLDYFIQNIKEAVKKLRKISGR